MPETPWYMKLKEVDFQSCLVLYYCYFTQDSFITAGLVDGRSVVEDVEGDDEEREFVELDNNTLSEERMNEPLNYIGGYICRKLGLEGSSHSKPIRGLH